MILKFNSLSCERSVFPFWGLHHSRARLFGDCGYMQQSATCSRNAHSRFGFSCKVTLNQVLVYLWAACTNKLTKAHPMGPWRHYSRRWCGCGFRQQPDNSQHELQPLSWYTVLLSSVPYISRCLLWLMIMLHLLPPFPLYHNPLTRRMNKTYTRYLILT